MRYMFHICIVILGFAFLPGATGTVNQRIVSQIDSSLVAVVPVAVEVRKEETVENLHRR